ncbi:uncharacterized protein BX663DRAFT_514357 [Cokeromyces recurvatus]|uniref:uncharacterized protein n=1 Tax=Cokeromyces recurvatus TaxID=90255 RepID=UPI00222092AD|nr:uncharacterized protein BX663DRAFT_514357 [Cokeromyces recurvatus]KAI7901422.1 hypothetical protein BX663DRAFT_514357 [Cokeromyces recurvatus]
MESKSMSKDLNEQQQQQPIEQFPNRSMSKPRPVSSHLISPVKTNRKQPILIDDDELNKNISSEYQDIQIRTLTKWINVQLSRVGEHITFIDKDLKDGKKLLKLLSVVANNPNLKPEKGSMRIHELSNVAQALKFLQDKWGADNLPAVASEAIVNGDVKSTLAITFFIMLKYQIYPILSHKLSMMIPAPLPSISTGSTKPLQEAKLVLLYWARSQLEDYVANHVLTAVQDFSRSWRSGLAFCLLVHKHDPDLIPALFTEYLHYASHKETWHRLLTLAFDIAEEELDVPKYLEPADLLVEYPHEPSVMMYVSEMYKVMSNTLQQQETNEKKEKRLHDIALVVSNRNPIILNNVVETEENDKSPLTDQFDNPNTTVESLSLDDQSNQLSKVPQPETLSDDVYQQLDILSSSLDNAHQDDDDDETLDVVMLQTLLERTYHNINQLDSSSEEKEILSNRYNQLREKWEQLTKRCLNMAEHHSMSECSSLKSQIKEIIPINNNKKPLHPLDGTIEIAEEFEASLSRITQLVEMSDEKEGLKTELETIQLSCQLFRRGVTFSQITTAINDELNFIQQMMTTTGISNNTVTDELIQNLENRIHVVCTTIQGVRDEYEHDLLCYDSSSDVYYSRFIDCIDNLQERYETIRDWVDQVRVWFLEAERIRTWIDQHIQIVEQRNETDDNIDPVSREITISDDGAIRLHEEHEHLKQEIERFDSDDMDRLRAHVKILTHSSDSDKELTPADTSTIEITLTTLNKLGHLTKLIDERSHRIELLLLRIKWENLFSDAVQWIASTDKTLDAFLRGKARWSEKEELNYTSNATVDYLSDEENTDQINDRGIEGVIKTLVSLERKIVDFDQGPYSDVLDAYQGMETLRNESMPDYLETRQLGFESAFEDLMKRVAFSRKVVEQLLSMISTVERFKELRDRGEQLRQSLLQDVSSDDNDNNNNDDDDIGYAEKIQAFKEESARLITNANTYISYPTPPEMSTAMGANDARDSEITNESIKSVISTYSMSLALIADGLDQLLMSRYQVLSLQQRAEEAYEAMTRVRNWMDERIRILNKSRLDIILYDPSMSISFAPSLPVEATTKHLTQRMNNGFSNNSSNQTMPMAVLDDEKLLYFEKERDMIASKLDQIENDELVKLLERVRELEYDVDASNAVSIDRSALINHIEKLEERHKELKELLALRGSQLDALKHRLQWENQWSKSNSYLHTIARKMCDFNIKKTRYDPSKENIDKPSYQGDHETVQALNFLKDKVTELGERYLMPLAESYSELVNSFTKLTNDKQDVNSVPSLLTVLPDFILNKQTDLKFKYEDLKLLTAYTSELVTQRAVITEFLLRAQDAHQEGEKIKEAIFKRIRRILTSDEMDSFDPLEARIKKLKEEMKSIWKDCGEKMPYPVYNGNWLKTLPQSVKNQQQTTISSESEDGANSSVYRSQVRAQIKTLLDQKMEELSSLSTSIDQCMQSYHEAENSKALIKQYEQDAYELKQWIDKQIESLKHQYIDVSDETFLGPGLTISDLKKARLEMSMEVDSFESNKVKVLHDHIAQFMEDSVERQKRSQTVDISSVAHYLGDIMERLSDLKHGLSYQAMILDAATMRDEWENHYQTGLTKLEEMNEQLRQFNIKKNQWISQEEHLSELQVKMLEQDLTELMDQKNKFQEFVLPGIQMSYDSFTEYFPKLPKPIAVPDFFEARMESLNRTSARLQEHVENRTRELELIKQRVQCEDVIRQAILYLSKHEMLIETFIEEKARWNNDNSLGAHDNNDNNDNEEEFILRTELSNLYVKFKDYEQDVIMPLQERFNTLVQEVNHHDNNSMTLLTNTFMKKMEELQKAQDYVNYSLDFSNQVISQRCLISAFILRTAQLEQSAELIREEFMANTNNNIPLEDLLDKHNERLEKFKAGIDDVRKHLATTIPFPVRNLDNISTQTKMKDETTNSVIQEVIDIRNSRLEDLWSDLQLLLESKERVSRRRFSLHSFKKQAKLAETWINSRLELLDQTNFYTESSLGKTVDIERLKEAVGLADSVEQAMNASENVLALLNIAYEKSLAAFEDHSIYDKEDDELLGQDINDIVKPTQARITQAWTDLLSKATFNKKARTALLIETKIQSWLKSLDHLSAQVEAKLLPTVEQLTLWTNEIQQLETTSYESLKTDLEANEKIMDKHEIASLKESLLNGMETAKAIRAKLVELQSTVYLDQLIKKYVEDTFKLQELISIQTNEMNNIKEEYQVIAYEHTSEYRRDRYHSLVSKYKGVMDCIISLKDSFSDISSQYSAIEAINPNYDNTKYTEVTEALKKLEKLGNDVSTLIARSFKWNKYFDTLQSVQKDLENAQNSMMNTSYVVDYNKMNETFDTIESLLINELSDLSDDLSEDTMNSNIFNSQKATLNNLLNSLRLKLKGQIVEAERVSLIQIINETVDRLCKECNEQLTKISKHNSAIVFDDIKDTLHSTIDKCESIIKSSETVYSACQNELETLQVNQYAKLVSMLDSSDDQSNQILIPIVSSLEKLNDVIQSEKNYSSIATLLSQFIDNQMVMLATIDEGINKLGNHENLNKVIVELERQLETLDESILENSKLSQSIKSFTCKTLCQTDSCVETITDIVNNRDAHLNKKYSDFKQQLLQAQEAVGNNNKYQQIMIKLNDNLQFIFNMTESVKTFQSSGTGIESAERELEDFCSDFYSALDKKTKAVDSLIADYAKGDENNNDISKLRQQISTALNQFDTLVNTRKKEVLAEGDLSGFLRIMEEIDKQIASLMAATEQASPHHSTIINNKFVKSELQALLKTLVTSFKQHQQAVNDILERARGESKKRLLDNHERVLDSLQKATKRWAQAQSAAAARERELQACIHQLDHEFFTKLAMAKSLSPTPHKALPLINAKRYAMLNDKSFGRVSPFPVNNRREDATNGKKVINNIPVSTHSSGNKPSNNYVPDPNNELDMQLGYIVNSSPYRVTVKVVPGQVGKYWFGDFNPRLVYCRILPSRMVMVRVGGGWVELSKFLRDHKLTEGVYSRPESANDNSTSYQLENGPFQEAYLQYVRPSSPSGRITIRGGGGVDKHNSSLASTRSSSKSSGSRSRSPLPGYINGDKYISIDEEGNQIVLKMKRADDDAKTPIINKKKYQ